MGMGGDVNGCGLCAKYSLFIANFVMFVSKNRTIIPIAIINFNPDFFLNFIFQIGGAVLFGLGIWTLVDRSFMKELLGTNLFSGTVYVLIVTAAIVCLVSFFGCFGAAKEVKCLILFVSVKQWPNPFGRRKLIIFHFISFAVLRHCVFGVCRYADWWHLGLRISGESSSNDAPRNVLIAEIVWQQSSNYIGLGRNANPFEMLRH